MIGHLSGLPSTLYSKFTRKVKVSSTNREIPDLTIWDLIRDCATSALAKLVAGIESDIASDKTLAGLQKTGSIRIAMQARARKWMEQAYGCCLNCWKEGGNRQETPEFRLSMVFYGLSPFYSKEMLKLLRLAAGVSFQTIARLEKGQSSLRSDASAMLHASEVWESMFATWHATLPPVVTFTYDDGSLTSSSSSGCSQRVVTNAPPPITEPSGRRGWGAPEAKPAEIPTKFPPDFPPTLRLRMHVIVSQCVKALPDRSKLDRLCAEIVSRSADLLCTAVQEGVVKAYAAPDHLNDVLHYVRVANCENDSERYRIEKLVANSDEWLSMLTRLAECGELEAPPRKPRLEAKPANDRKKRIEDFITTLQEAGYPISKKDIWRAAGYRAATEFERFQRADERTTTSSEANFTRVLNMDPEAFIALLKKIDSR
jgi:hypothetical protein